MNKKGKVFAIVIEKDFWNRRDWGVETRCPIFDVPCGLSDGDFFVWNDDVLFFWILCSDDELNKGLESDWTWGDCVFCVKGGRGWTLC